VSTPGTFGGGSVATNNKVLTAFHYLHFKKML